MKIFVLSESDYDYHNVIGYFSSRELAEKHIELLEVAHKENYPGKRFVRPDLDEDEVKAEEPFVFYAASHNLHRPAKLIAMVGTALPESIALIANGDLFASGYGLTRDAAAAELQRAIEGLAFSKA